MGGRLLLEVGIWRVGSTVAESSGALCEPTAHGVLACCSLLTVGEGPGVAGCFDALAPGTAFTFPGPGLRESSPPGTNECLPLQTSRHFTYSRIHMAVYLCKIIYLTYLPTSLYIPLPCVPGPSPSHLVSSLSYLHSFLRLRLFPNLDSDSEGVGVRM
jgi:hypothetical protein